MLRNLHELNQHFGIDDVLHFSAGEGGLWRAEVTTDHCVAEVYRHGAHLTRWRPAGHDEVLWMSSRAVYAYGTAIRGGVPICFPWFAGNKPASEPNGPSHGYARTKTWEFVEAGMESESVSLTLATIIESFELRYTVTFGQSLKMQLEVTNTAGNPAGFEAALHTYFVISQIKQVQVLGLEGADYIDTVGGAEEHKTQDDQPIRFDRETDRTYSSSATTKIVDPGLSRVITIEKGGSGSTVVWNPWAGKAKGMVDFGDEEWPGMLCVESGVIEPNAVTLEPGAAHTMWAEISVETVRQVPR